MQTFVLEKTITLKENIEGLVQVNIDDYIDYLTKSEGILLSGKVSLDGEVKCKDANLPFHDQLEIDIMAPFDQLADKKALQFKVEDFDYAILDNQITFYLKVKIEGWNDVKSTFPEQPPHTVQEDKEREVEAIKPSPAFTYMNDPSLYQYDEPIPGSLRPLEEPIAEEPVKFDDVYEEDFSTVIQGMQNMQIEEYDKDLIIVNPNIKKGKNTSDQKLEEVFREILKSKVIERKNSEVKADVSYPDPVEPCPPKTPVDACEPTEDVQPCGPSEIVNSCESTKTPTTLCAEVGPEISEVESSLVIVPSTCPVPEKAKKFNYFDLFRNTRNESAKFWRYRVILPDDTYESIARELKVDIRKLKEINQNKVLEIGILVKIPL